jgi:hypothetical protein
MLIICPFLVEPSNARPLVGVKIYEYQQDFKPLVSRWKKMGISDAFVSPELARNQAFREAAQAGGIFAWLIFPVFQNPEKLAQTPEFYARTAAGKRAEKEWVQFVCPSRRDYRTERLEGLRSLLKDCQPDGLSLDFIRFFSFWEKVDPGSGPDAGENTCFCEHCLQDFQGAARLRIPLDLRSAEQCADWILTNHRKEWAEWKCRKITSMVAALSREARKNNPEIRLNLHLVPWREQDFQGAWQTVVGQDVRALAPLVDYLSPMCYAQMVRRDAEWIHSVAEDMARRGKKPVLTSIQVKEEYFPGKISASQFGEYLKQALAPPSQGVVFYNWAALEEDPEKQEVVSKVVASIP